MSENENPAPPRRRRVDRYRENPEPPAADFPAESDSGVRYAVGNSNRGNGRFGESQRLYDSQSQWTVPPYASGSYDPVRENGREEQNPWVSGVQDTVSASWGQPAYDGPDMNRVPENPRYGRGGKEPRSRKHMWMVLVPLIVLAVGAAVAAGIWITGVARSQADEKRQSEARAAALREQVGPYDSLYCENVYVDGISLGGLSQEQARAAVEKAASDRNWTITLMWNGEVYDTLTPATTGVSYDTETALYNAWQQGHEGTDAQRAEAMKALAEQPYHGESITGEPDLTQVEARVSLLADQLYVAPEDAYFKEFDGLRTDPFIFEKEKLGVALDTKGLEAQITRMIHGCASGDLDLSDYVREMQPAVTVESLRSENYALIGQGITSISSSSQYERNQNIRRAFDLINGKVIKPGKQFSFNAIVGERTEKNGFFPATEYVYGEHVEGIGGGVCQASSTIYLAAIRANLRINKRTPHSLAVNYTDYGKDATVYWYDRHKVDLAFTNNTDYDIFITAAVQSDPKKKNRWICVVNIYGHSLGEGITYDIVTEETVLPAPEEPEIRRDKDARYVMYKDEQYVLQEAADGTSVDSWRVKYENGQEVSREHLATDVYEAKPQIIYVGTRERPEP